MQTKTPDPKQAVQSLKPLQWAGLILINLLIPLLLMLCGRDFRWWQAWVFCVLLLAATIGGRVWAEKRHPGLLAERQSFENAPGVKAWDKVLAPLTALSFSFFMVIVAGLDHRFAWSEEFSLALNLLGLILIALGYAFSTWALVENRFFSGVVRIQSDRGHVVCDSGPYRLVRHPGYAGNLLALPGLVLALNSMWALLPAAFAFIIIFMRTWLEDRTLQAELPGYVDYARRVRYRLIPGIF